MATDREVIAKYADATNRRPGCPRETLGRFIALPALRKEVEFESSFDGGCLLIGEDVVHEQIRRDVGHVYAPPGVPMSGCLISARARSLHLLDQVGSGAFAPFRRLADIRKRSKRGT